MSKVLKKEQKIEIGGKELVVRKLPMRKIVEILTSIERVPSVLANIDKNNVDTLVETLPIIVATSLPVFADILVGVLENQVTSDWLLDTCGFDDVMEIVTVALDVNNITGIIERIKKVQALTKQA